MDKATRRTRTSRSSSRGSDSAGVQVGQAQLRTRSVQARGNLLNVVGDRVYCISHYDKMQPFLIALASPSDHWMFLSSTGAVTAGRKSSEHTLFPYVTEDKLHDAASTVGPCTIILVERKEQTLLWEPFTDRYEGLYKITRTLSKNSLGNRVTFEEVNESLSLRFAYTWQIAPGFGFVRQVRLTSLWKYPIRARVLDGLRNLQPAGVPSMLQDLRSSLVDGYKINELEQGLGLFRLSSLIVDRPEPAEALTANTVWTLGPASRINLTPRNILLSTQQIPRFRQGQSIHSEHLQKAVRGAYLAEYTWVIPPEKYVDWNLVANVEQDLGDVSELLERTKDRATLRSDLYKNLQHGDRELRSIVAAADGFQRTHDRQHDMRHGLNTLYNVQRGGIPVAQTSIQKSDLVAFVRKRNLKLADHPYWQQVPARLDLSALPECQDPQLSRLLAEYMPLGYSRRHGDPSRPWNMFNIEIHDDQGEIRLNYEGNWRDVFQNWEALACSFPVLLPRMIATFVNASTADGYNPYRIGSDGIDWEIPDPHDPWSHIGYWGDHQIVYLLRLLEQAMAYDPEMLTERLTQRLYSYANVPYRLDNQDEIIDHPRHSIQFDEQLQAAIEKRVREIGNDGRLVLDDDGDPILATLAEKLLIPVLAKLTNFVPGAGIWMNTQRPEWNDALNGMPGWGCSMVTLHHLHAHLALLSRLFRSDGSRSVDISRSVADLMKETGHCLEQCDGDQAVEDPAFRWEIMNALGQAGSTYRQKVYTNQWGPAETKVTLAELAQFLDLARTAIAPTLRAGRGDDDMHVAYAWIKRTSDATIEVEPNLLMLEGQVAALESGLLSAQEAVSLLDALKRSSLWSKAQQSYLLYPDQAPTRFVSTNRLTTNQVVRCSLVRKLAQAGDRRLINRTATGDYYFHPALISEAHLEAMLDELEKTGYAKAVAKDRSRIQELYRDLFRQDKFNGRATRFFKYEGLGCVYWHMVSKLMLAIQRVFYLAVDQDEAPAITAQLAKHYYFVRQGLGYDWEPARFGAFPIDPHSHSASDTRAQQPGLTGRVKEDLLARWGELGLRVVDGCITFNPALLRKSEFLPRPATFKSVDTAGKAYELTLEPGSLCFTCAQVPVVYKIADKPSVTVNFSFGRNVTRDSLALTRKESLSVFHRDGSISLIEVGLQPALRS